MKNSEITPPCYKCELRTESCHANCEKYIAYKQERAVEKEKQADTRKKNFD